MNCNALANGWLWTNVISEAAQGSVREVHARQWGRPADGGLRDK